MEKFEIEFCADMVIEYEIISGYREPIEIQLEDIFCFGEPLSAYRFR